MHSSSDSIQIYVFKPLCQKRNLKLLKLTRLKTNVLFSLSRKPRWLALSAAVGSIGLVLSGSPHFLTGPYDPRGIDDVWNICKTNSNFFSSNR